MSERSAGPTPASQPAKPPAGSQPSLTANRSTIRMPNQNSGTAMPIWLNAMTP